MAGKGGGAWKVAYADFVTAMMAFFMVMWLVGQKDSVKQSVAQYFRDPYGSKRNPKADSGRGKTGSTSIGPLKTGRGPGRGLAKQQSESTPSPTERGAAASKPSLFVLHDGDQSRTGSIIWFPENSAELDETSKDQLLDLAALLVGKANKIEIRGHSSRLALPADSSYSDAWQLSYARCLATMKFLSEQGVDPERMRLSQAGVHEPYSLRGGEEWQKKNSRVEIYSLSEYVHEYQGTSQERAEQFWDTPEPGDNAQSEHAEHDAPADDHSTNGHGTADGHH